MVVNVETLRSVAVMPSATSTALTSALGASAVSDGCRGWRGVGADFVATGFDSAGRASRVDG